MMEDERRWMADVGLLTDMMNYDEWWWWVLSRAGNRWRESGCEQMSIIVDHAVHKTIGIYKTAPQPRSVTPGSSENPFFKEIQNSHENLPKNLKSYSEAISKKTQQKRGAGKLRKVQVVNKRDHFGRRWVVRSFIEFCLSFFEFLRNGKSSYFQVFFWVYCEFSWNTPNKLENKLKIN